MIPQDMHYYARDHASPLHSMLAVPEGNIIRWASENMVHRNRRVSIPSSFPQRQSDSGSLRKSSSKQCSFYTWYHCLIALQTSIWASSLSKSLNSASSSSRERYLKIIDMLTIILSSSTENEGTIPAPSTLTCA